MFAFWDRLSKRSAIYLLGLLFLLITLPVAVLLSNQNQDQRQRAMEVENFEIIELSNYLLRQEKSSKVNSASSNENNLLET